MTGAERVLVAVELGFMLPIAVVFLLTGPAIVPPQVLLGMAGHINEVIGHARGLDAHATRWLREGYWAQDAVLAATGAAIAYPFVRRASRLLPGVVGLAVPLSVVAVIAGFNLARPHQVGVLVSLGAIWAFGAFSVWGLERERHVADRRIMAGGIGVVLVAAALLLRDLGAYSFQVSAWGATVGGGVLWVMWVRRQGYLASGKSRGVAEQADAADEAQGGTRTAS